MPCDDSATHYNHPVARGACSPPVQMGGCAKPHRGGRFTVCDSCQLHTSAMLHLRHASPAIDFAAHPDPPARNDYGVSNLRRISTYPHARSPPASLQRAGMAAIPPQIPPPDPPWGGFVTRLCVQCEDLVQSERHYRENGVIGLPLDAHKWHRYPNNSCTCLYRLGFNLQGPRLCYHHRRSVWEELEKAKDQNDNWLRNVEYDEHTKQLKKARPETKWRRRQDKTWRACRCGRDANSEDNAYEALMCMACEGYIGRVQLSSSRLAPDGWVPADLLRRLRNANFKLGRRVQSGS